MEEKPIDAHWCAGIQADLDRLLGYPEPEQLDHLTKKQVKAVFQTIQANQQKAKKLVQELLIARSRLETSCNRYLDLFDRAPVAYFTINGRGRIVSANLSGAAFLGVERCRLIGRSFFDFLSPPHREQVRQQLCKTADMEVERRCRVNLVDIPTGQTTVLLKAVHVKAEQSTAPSDDLFRVTVTDISEYQEAEKRLRQIEKKHQTIMDNIEDGYYEVDLKGTFTFVNASLCRHFGYKREEMLGMNYREYTDPDTSRHMAKEFNQVYLTSIPTKHLEFPVIGKDGVRRYSEGSIALIRDHLNIPVGFRGIIRDISQRKKMEKALRESEEKYRCLVENATDGIIIMQDRAITFANQKIMSMLGYAQTEITETMKMARFVHPSDQIHLLRYYRRALKKQENLEKSIVLRAIHKTGEERLVQVQTVSITWDGEPAVLSFIRDITDQKALEEKVQHALKMEAIGTLAGGIAHDFNNILGAIVLNTELALDDIPVGSETEYVLDQVLQSSQRAKELVDQILTFSRNAEVDRKPIQVDLIVRETIKMLRAMLPATILIRQSLSSNLWIILANPTQIQQLVINLCTNAAHAMQSKGGRLEISLRNVVLDKKEAERAGVSPGKFVRLMVTDEGHGIAPENLERIFDPFFTTKRTGEGTGLGLSVVHGIVSKHRGAISVDSRLGSGTVFTIQFPVINDIVKPMVSAPYPEQTGEGQRILFVDDEASLLDAGRRMLLRLGYQVDIAGNALEALEIFHRKPEAYDLVLTDMTMPYTTGLDLSVQLRQIRPGIPIVLCTGFNEKVSPESIQQFDITGFLTKPYTQQEVARKLTAVFRASSG